MGKLQQIDLNGKSARGCGGAALITTPAWASEQSPQRAGGLRRWWGSVEAGRLGMLLLSKQGFDPNLFKQTL